MSDQQFTIYSKNPCVQCDATYRQFGKAGLQRDVDYRVIDVGDPANAAHLDYIKDLGHQQAPVVVVDDQTHWSGYRPDRIKQYAAARAQEPAAAGAGPAPPSPAPEPGRTGLARVTQLRERIEQRQRNSLQPERTTATPAASLSHSPRL